MFLYFSLERRRERYQILYVCKVLENLVSNSGIHYTINARHGRTCTVPVAKTTATARVQTLIHNNFSVCGPCLFNCLPKSLRDLTNCDLSKFKQNLDRFLRLVHDKPTSPGLKTSGLFNSLLDLQGHTRNINFESN